MLKLLWGGIDNSYRVCMWLDVITVWSFPLASLVHPMEEGLIQISIVNLFLFLEYILAYKISLVNNEAQIIVSLE